MIVTWQRTRDVIVAGISAEVIGIVIMAYAFITPMVLYQQILFVMLVTLIVSLSTRLLPAIELTVDTASQRAWMSELTLREALDGAANAIARGEFSGFDWRAATEAAAADIKQNQDDDEFKRKMSSMPILAVLIYGTAIAFTALRGLIAYGIARLLLVYAPKFVLLVTGLAP